MTRNRILLSPTSPDEGVPPAVIERARTLGFRGFVLPRGPVPHRRPGEEWVRRTRAGFQPVVGGSRNPPFPLISVRSPAELERALSGAASSGGVVLRWRGDRMIPLETAVLKGRHRFRVWVATDRLEEVPGALGALEHGADRVIVEVATPQDVETLARLVEAPAARPLDWQRASVIRRLPAGVSERIIVDTSSMLSPEEGLLLGSSAGLLFHVASEATGSRFTRARPFRVNAGSPHSYVLMADGSTRYLSELEAGDAVLVVAPRGPSRAVRVGRLKIERRPMVLVAARSGSQVATIFLQEAETVRLSTDRGRVPTTSLRPGRTLVCVRLPKGRHLGTAVDESVEER